MLLASADAAKLEGRRSRDVRHTNLRETRNLHPNNTKFYAVLKQSTRLGGEVSRQLQLSQLGSSVLSGAWVWLLARLNATLIIDLPVLQRPQNRG